MKTISSNLKKLPEDIQEKAKKYITCDLQQIKPMKRWFDWADTEEGYNYWKIISKMYKL